MLRIGVLVSGRGSNLQAIMDSCREKKINAMVVLVLSDKEDAYALKRASDENIKAVGINPKNFASKEDYEAKIVEYLREEKVDLVCLAGYMRLVGINLLKAYPQKIINIHPALLPSFPGLHGQAQAFEYGVKFSGCTVHFVDDGMDTGPIILQKVVKVEDNDTEDSLSARILEQEHIAFSEAIGLYAENKLKIVGRKVIIN